MTRPLALVLSAACLGLATPALAKVACDSPPFSDVPALAELYTALSEALEPFPTLRATLDDDLSFCLSDETLDARGYFTPEDREVVLASDMEPPLMLAVAVHELRHVQQFDNGSCPSLTLGMSDYAEAVFAMEADASATSIVVADRNRQNGQPDMWQALAAWPMQADIVEAYAAAYAETADTGVAASAAFAQWYANKARHRSYYLASCSNYLEEMERTHLLPRYEPLSDGYFDTLCLLPNGQPYPCAKPE